MLAVIAPPAIAARTLVHPDLFAVLAKRTVTEFGVDPTMADRVLDQATAFLATASTTSQPQGLSPSKQVDPGWHAWLLYPARLREFFVAIDGRHVDHVPSDDPFAQRPARVASPQQALTRTVDAIAAAGYLVDPQLWLVSSDKCHTCSDEGCSTSGPDGNENTENQKPPR